MDGLYSLALLIKHAKFGILGPHDAYSHFKDILKIYQLLNLILQETMWLVGRLIQLLNFGTLEEADASRLYMGIQIK